MDIGYDRYGSSIYGRVPSYDPFGSSYSFKFDASPITPVAKPAAPKPEPAFKAGDKVTVKLDTTATVGFVNSGGSLDVTLADGTEMDYFPAAHATLQDPDNWPPTVGQVWKANGKNYGIRKNQVWADRVTAFPIDQSGGSYSKGNGPGATLDDFKKLRPTLVG